MRLGVLLWGLGVIGPRASHGQHAYLELAAEHSRVRLYHEAAAVASEGGAAVVVSFRIPNPALVFTVDRQAAQGFWASPELTVELFREGVHQETRVWREGHRAPTFEATQDPALDAVGMVRFGVDPGAYAYRVLFTDAHVGTTLRSPLRTITVPDPAEAGVGQAMLARSVRAAGGEVAVELVNLGGDAPFGEAVYAVVPVALPADSLARTGEVSLRYRLRRMGGSVLRDREEGRRWTRGEPGKPRGREAADQEPIPEGGAVVKEGAVPGAAFLPVGAMQRRSRQPGLLRWSKNTGPRAFLVPIDLDGETLENGAYVLETEVVAAGFMATAQTLFATHWRNMPISLYNAEVAIENLGFIEERKTVRDMLRGRHDDKEHRIEAYWQQRDPTPGTAFNELMAEYYGRIDDAAFRFRTDTVPGPDGLRTDQARVFIRNGPADTTERVMLSSGGVQETWTYADGRQYVFRAASSLEPFKLQDR